MNTDKQNIFILHWKGNKNEISVPVLLYVMNFEFKKKS